MQSENLKKLGQKIDFLAHFWKFSDYALLHPVSYTPIFMQNESSQEDAQSWKVSSL